MLILAASPPEIKAGILALEHRPTVATRRKPVVNWSQYAAQSGTHARTP